MKATISKECNGKANYRFDKKETIKTYIGISGKNEVVRFKLYMGRSPQASEVYCNAWIHDATCSLYGHGQAGGYGYDKQSAAVSEALQNAGIKLDEDIAGRGSSLIEDAILAIMEALGFTDNFIVEA